jgi:cardiolipin synthase
VRRVCSVVQDGPVTGWRGGRLRCASRVRAGWVTAAAVAVAVALLAGCGRTAGVSLPEGPVPGAIGNQILLEPDHGIAPVYALLRSPRSTLDMTMYQLVDDEAVGILIADVARGVRVRVVLDQRLQRARNKPAFDLLRAHGVQVVWADPRFAASHQKTFVVDGSVAVIMSLNLSSRYYPNTRDVGVVTTDADDVRAIAKVFDADFAGRSVRADAADDLVWSPGAEDDLVALVDRARTSVAVETEVLTDKPVIDALVRASRRGVRTSLVMTYQADWAPNFTKLAAAGVSVRYYNGEFPLYIHAKVFVVDAGTPTAKVYLGSQNLSSASLSRNRELGIVVTEASAVSSMQVVLARDSAGGKAWHS